jgi:hypothetical protein
LPQPIGFYQLGANPTDVILDGTRALVGTGSNVLIVDLTNPSQPFDGGQINGTFGSRLALDPNGVLIAAGNIPATSVQTATLGSPCAGYRAQIKNGAPRASVTYPLKNLDWTIGNGSFSYPSSGEGFVLSGVALGGRYMADEMSLPYLLVQRNVDGTANGPTTPAYMECQLSDAGGGTGACTNSPTSRSQLLQFQYVNSNPNYFALQAQYLLDRLDGDPDVTPQVPDSCVVVTQDHEFWKEGYDACEASDVLSCARFKPIASYQYFTDSGPGIKTVNSAQRFLFNPNSGYSAPPAPATGGAASSVTMLMFDCEHSDPLTEVLALISNPGALLDAYPACLNPLAVTGNYPILTNPLTRETTIRVIQNGKAAPPDPSLLTALTSNLTRADNLHLRNTEDGLPISEPTSNGNPGCPECVHIHWRWAQLLERNDYVGATVVSPRFNNNGGNAIIPPNSNQDVDIALDYLNTSETGLDPSNQLWAGGAQTIFSGLQGSPLAFWYSGTGHTSGESFFVHGGFFSSLRVTIGNPGIITSDTRFFLPLQQTFACPAEVMTLGECSVTSSITNKTGDPLHWVATLSDVSGNVINGAACNSGVTTLNGVACNPTSGDMTGASGTATINLPGNLSEKLILNIQVTDTATQWSTQRQAYVTEIITAPAPD